MVKRKIIYFLYNLFLLLVSIFLIPWFVIRNICLKRPVFPYFNLPQHSELQKLSGKEVVWLQAVSVGEAVVAKTLVEKLSAELSDKAFLVTTTTPTGQEMARKIMPETVAIAYFPFDIPFFIKRFIKTVQPKALLLVETELWPNAMRYMREFGCRVGVINGTVSEKAFKKYLRYKKLFAAFFENIDFCAMQSVEDMERFVKMGVPSEQIKVTGNCKFDQDYPSFTDEQIQSFREQCAWDWTTPIFLGASTHPGEEEIVLDAFMKLTNEQDYYLILAPRHPERAEEVIKLIKQRNLTFIRRSEGKALVSAQVLLLDTFGELSMAYAASKAIVVGGSLTDIGGHNVLEAAAQTKPVIYGPYMHKSLLGKKLLETVDAGFTVNDAQELADKVIEITKDENLYNRRAQAAYDAVFANKGAASRTVETVISFLK